MKLQINFHQLESTPSLKDMIETKSQKLSKFFDGHMNIIWTCSVDKEGHHSHVELHGAGYTLNANSTKDDLYKTFDDVIGKIEKQLAKQKSKVKDHIHHKHDSESY